MSVVRRLALATSGCAVVLAALLVAPAGANAAVASDPACSVRGTAGPDVLRGTAGDDVLCGLGGADVLVGLGGEDILIGGSGADVLVGGGGDDTLIGGAGDDTLVGGAGDDTLIGGAGDDTVVPGTGDDRLTAAAASDRGLEVRVFPDYRLPVGSRVTWTSLQSNPQCIARAAGSWTDQVGSGPSDVHFLLEASASPQCRGKSVHYRWQVRIQSPTSSEVIVAHVTADVDFGGVPEGAMGCSFATEGLNCNGRRARQQFTPLAPLILPLTLGPTG